MATIGTWEARERELLGNPSTTILPSLDAQDAIKAAVRRFSTDRPQVVSFDFPGNGTSYDLSLASLSPPWVPGFSQPVVEYPQGSRVPEYLDPAEVILYPSSSAPVSVRLLGTVPAAGRTARLYYTVPWAIPDGVASTDKIADVDFEPVASLAASVAARGLASRASAVVRSSIASASLAGTETEAVRWRDRAKELEQVYLDHVSGAPGGPAEAITDWDAFPSQAFIASGRAFLLRGRR